MNRPLLSIRGLSVEFRISRGIVKAVDNVDLDVFEGDIFGLAGESGCGKSVLAHSILRIVAPNGYIKSGRIMFGDDMRDVLSFDEKELKMFRGKDVAVVVQGAMNSLNPVMRVKEHFVDTVMAHEKASKEEIDKRASELLKLVRLDPVNVLKLFAHEISGGMKQRIISAIGYLLKPKLLILDEPTSSLDVLSQKFLVDLLKNIQKETKTTMLFITHDLATLAEIADTIAIMYCGNIVEVGGVEGIFYDPKHPYTAALLKTIPTIAGDIEDMTPIPGRIPDPVSPPPGCKFHPRCPFMTNECAKVSPKLEDIGNGRLVACHRFKTEGQPN